MSRFFLSLLLVFLFQLSASGQTDTLVNGTICLPLQKMHVTSGFGKRLHPVTGKLDFHKGIDLSARSEPVYAVMDGKIAATGFHPILGNFIRISHGEFISIYGHLSFLGVKIGQMVTAGEVIGLTGSSGRVTGEHLHFSLMLGGSYVNPLRFFLGAFTTPIQPITTKIYETQL